MSTIVFFSPIEQIAFKEYLSLLVKNRFPVTVFRTNPRIHVESVLVFRFMDVSVIIPVHNERDNLPRLWEELRAVVGDWDFSYEIIAVNDGSNDDSRELILTAARDFPTLRLVDRHDNGGMGNALMRGCEEAGGEYLVWMMADLSDRLSDIRVLVDKLREGYDLVVASRAIAGGSYGRLGRFKARLSNLYSLVTRRLFRIPAHDITNAFRGMRRDLVTRVRPLSADFAISPELAIKAGLLGASITEIPTVYRYRQNGDSHFKIFRMGWRYAGLYRWLWMPSKPRAKERE